MKSVTHNGREFLFVEVPEGAKSIEVINGNALMSAMLHWKGSLPVFLPSGSYRILCKASEAGEEQSRQIVEKVSGWSKELFYGYGSKCSDYRDIVDSAFDTATKSLHSLILSLGMEVGKTIILEKLK